MARAGWIRIISPHLSVCSRQQIGERLNVIRTSVTPEYSITENFFVGH